MFEDNGGYTIGEMYEMKCSSENLSGEGKK